MAVFSNTIKVTTTGAVNALNKLDTALKQAASSMEQFKATTAGGLDGGSFDDIAKGAERAAKAGESVSTRVGKSSEKAAKSVKSIGLSYKDVGRIIESQIIFSALSKLTQGFGEAADAAAEFQEQVARIAAIDESDLGFSGLRSEIESLAADLGRPLEEVGGAAFEALQNDLGTTEETFGILRDEAQKLALVTGGDLTQAVNALSSVYKTFGKDAEAVNGISGQFFGTINAGRITLKDLESSLGTLSPLATQIGVDFKELTNSLATITLTGTKANVATTQLRNVFNKLIKPTKALQAVYQELGVQGFEQLSEKSGGFVKALEVLRNQVGGDEQALAQLFNTIRANVGVLNILTNDTELYNETAKRSADSANRLSEAIDGIESTAAREAAKNAAELEVIFTRLGDRALDIQNVVTNAFLAVVGGSEKGVIALGTFTAGMTAATIAVTKFGVAAGVAFPPVIAFLAVLGTAGAVAEGLGRVRQAISATAKATAELEVERMQALVKTLKELREAQIDKVADDIENLDTVVNKIAVSANKTGKAIVDAFNIETGNIQATEAKLLEAFGDARTRVLKQIEDAIKSIDDKILESEKRIRGFTQDLEDVKFEFEIRGLTEGAQATERIKRASETIQEAFDKIKNVGLGDESEEIARNTAAEAVSQAKAALSAAERGKSQTQIAQAQRTLESAIKTQIALEERLINLRESLGKKNLIDQQNAFEKLSAEAKEQVKDVLDARKAIADAAASGASDEEVNKLKENLVKEVTEARAALVEAGQAEALKTFNLEEQFSEAVGALQQGLNETDLDWSKAIGSLRDQLANAPDLKAAVTLTANFDELAQNSGAEQVQKAVSDAIAQGGLPGEQLENVVESVFDVFKEQKALSDTIEDSSVKTQANAKAAALAFADAFTQAKIFGDKATTLTDPVLEQLGKLDQLNKQQIEALIKNLEAAIPAIAENTEGIFAPFTDAQAEFLKKGVNDAIAAAKAALEGVDARALFDPANLEAAKAILDRAATEDINKLGLEVDSEGFEAVNTALEKIELDAKNAEKSVARIGTEAALKVVTGLRGVNTATQGLKSAAAAAQSAYQRLLDIAKEALATAKEAASVNSSNSSNGLFFGGRPVYRNEGGATRGQDTIPAMLSPEEFVVNSKAARNFFPQLQAINAGNAPAASGGVGDTNITIGDINVNSTSDVPATTARDISIALKRELRRGTS